MSLLDKSVVLLPPYATKGIYTVVKEFEHKGTAKVRLRHPETGSEHAKPVSQIRIAEDAEIAAGHRIDAHKVFEEWFKFQPFYAKLVYIHGDRIFDFDMSEQTYHCLPVNISWLTWQERQSEVDELQKKNAWLSGVACRENKRANKLQEENVNTTVLLGKTIQEKNDLQKRLDAQTKHIEMALIAVKDIHKSAIDEFNDWDVINEKAPKLCEHLQNLSVAVGELEQALKGGAQ